MLKKLLTSLLILLSYLPLISCSDLSNSVEERELICGPEVSGRPNHSFLPIVKGSDHRFLKAFFINSNAEVAALPVTTRGCIEIDLQISRRGWLVATSSEIENLGFIADIETINDSSRIELKYYPEAPFKFSCAKSEDADRLYISQSQEFPIPTPGSERIFNAFTFNLLNAPPEPSKQPQLRSSIEKLDPLDMSDYASETYEFQLRTFDFLKVDTSGFFEEQTCTIDVDHEAPQTDRSGDPEKAIVVSPQELIELSARDKSNFSMFSCWDKKIHKDKSLDPKNEYCPEMVRSRTSVRAPVAGDWFLNYYFVDAAGNNSEVFSKSYSVFDREKIAPIETDIQLGRMQVEKGDYLDSLFSYTRAAIKKANLKSQIEKDSLGSQILGGLLRYILSDTFFNEFEGAGSTGDELWTVNNFLTYGATDGIYLVDESSGGQRHFSGLNDGMVKNEVYSEKNKLIFFNDFNDRLRILTLQGVCG